MIRLTIAACLLTACGAPQQPTADDANDANDADDDRRVEEIEISLNRAEVGRAFEAEITWRDNYIPDGAAEVDVSGLPPGLRFEPGSRSIVGTPTKAGFFTINVAVRKKPSKSRLHKPKPDERWWPTTFELSIYNPVE